MRRHLASTRTADFRSEEQEEDDGDADGNDDDGHDGHDGDGDDDRNKMGQKLAHPFVTSR